LLGEPNVALDSDALGLAQPLAKCNSSSAGVPVAERLCCVIATL
jgi:hypothetical protein